MAKQKPELSCIIITLNEEKCLPKLLNSLKTQTFKNFEVIVADYNSTDKTRAIAKKYGCVIVKGGRQAAARNNGARIAKADYFVFLDADSVLPKDFLEINFNKFKKLKVGTATAYLNPISSNILDKVTYFLYNCIALILSKFHPLATGSCIFTKKKVFKKVHGFDEKLVLAEDHDYGRRTRKFGFAILPRGIYNSTRRMDKEGRIKFISKMIYGGVYRITLNKEIKKPLFNYEDIR